MEMRQYLSFYPRTYRMRNDGSFSKKWITRVRRSARPLSRSFRRGMTRASQTTAIDRGCDREGDADRAAISVRHITNNAAAAAHAQEQLSPNCINRAAAQAIREARLHNLPLHQGQLATPWDVAGTVNARCRRCGERRDGISNGPLPFAIGSG